MPPPPAWNNAPIIHTTRHGWEVAAFNLQAGHTGPLARRGSEILWVNNQQPKKFDVAVDHWLPVARESLEKRGFQPPRYSSILLDRNYIGLFYSGKRGDNIGIPTIGIVEGRQAGLGSAAILSLFYGAAAAGGQLELLEITNTIAFQTMLTKEGFGSSTAHLVKNELLLDDRTLRMGPSAYPRKEVLLRDYSIEEIPLDTLRPDLREFATTGIPENRHAWWVEKIVVRKD